MPDGQPPDEFADLEARLEAELTEAAQKPPTFSDRLMTFISGPIGLAIIGFILSGVAATTFSKWLDDLSKKHELELSSQQRATESVKAVTDLLFERRIRARLVQTSILRNAPLDELKDRKKGYDGVFIRYNKELESNVFRIREMFHGRAYGPFENILLFTITDLFNTLDACITGAYDYAISAQGPHGALEILNNCNHKDSAPLTVDAIQTALGYCTYSYTNALFTLVQGAQGAPFSAELSPEGVADISAKCQIGFVSPSDLLRSQIQAGLRQLLPSKP